MTQRHPDDPGYQGWVIILKHPSGLPLLSKAWSGPCSLATVFDTREEAEAIAARSIPTLDQRNWEVRPVLVYMAVGELTDEKV